MEYWKIIHGHMKVADILQTTLKLLLSDQFHNAIDRTAICQRIANILISPFSVHHSSTPELQHSGSKRQEVNSAVTWTQNRRSQYRIWS